MKRIKQSLYYLLILVVASFLAIKIFNKEYGADSFSIWLILIFLIIIRPLITYINKRKSYQRTSLKLKNVIFLIFELTLISTISVLPGLISLQTPEKLFFHGDEAIISRNAEDAVKSSFQTGNWNFLGHEDGTISRFPALWYVFQGLIINSLGPSVASVKTFSLLAHLGIVITQFILISKFFNKYLGWAWVLFYSSMPIVIHFSITGYQNLHSTFFAVLCLVLALFALSKNNKERKNLLLTISGVVGGIGMYFYLSSLLIPAYLFLVLLVSSFFFRPKMAVFLQNMLIVFFPFLLISLPFWIVSMNDYNFVAGRSRAFLPFTSEFNTSSAGEIVMTQLTKSFVPYVRGNFNGDGEHYVNLPAFIHPILVLVSLIGLIGLIISRKKFSAEQNFVHLSIVLTFITTIIFGSFITVNPPAVQRILTVFPFLTLFTACGLFVVIKIFDMNNKLPINLLMFFLFVIIITVSQLYSFFTKNTQSMSTMKKNNSLIQDLSSIIVDIRSKNKNLVLFTRIPVHMNDQIYYYSKGQVTPLPVNTQLREISEFDRYSEKYLLIDDRAQQNQDTLSSLANLNIDNKSNVWSKEDLELYKLNFFNNEN